MRRLTAKRNKLNLVDALLVAVRGSRSDTHCIDILKAR